MTNKDEKHKDTNRDTSRDTKKDTKIEDDIQALSGRVDHLDWEVSGMKDDLKSVMKTLDKFDDRSKGDIQKINDKLDDALKPSEPKYGVYVATLTLLFVMCSGVLGGILSHHNRDNSRLEGDMGKFQDQQVEMYKDIGVLDSTLTQEVQRNIDQNLQEQFERSQIDEPVSDWSGEDF